MNQSNHLPVPETMQPLLEALTAQLEATVGAKVQVRQRETPSRSMLDRLDTVFNVTVPGVETFPLLIECLGQAYPGEVQHRIYKLNTARLDYHIPRSPFPWPTTMPPLLAASDVDHDPFLYSPRVATMVAAEAFSPGAIDMLEEAGVGYFDLQSGAMFFCATGCYVKIRPVEKAPTRKSTRGTMDLFTDARACVVHALLHRPYEWMSVSDVAGLAETSTYTSSTVLQELEKRGWCEARGNNRTLQRRLSDPNALLDAWAKAWQSRHDHRTKWYAFMHEEWVTDALPNRLARNGIKFRWALTGAEAGNQYSPLLTGYQPVEIVIPPGKVKEMVDAIDVKPVDKGANVTLIERDPASLLFRKEVAEDAWIVSPIIAYLDLLDGRGRNKELAEALRQSLELDKDGT